MTDAISSFSTLLKIGDGATPETFGTIAEVLDIDGPDLGLDTEEVTSHDSANGWSEHIGTILNGGEVSFDVNFVPTDATHDTSTGLQGDMIDRTLRNFQLVLPDSGTTTYAFAALVTGFKAAEPVKGALRASVKLKISGAVTLS
jgi:predicted secreted protein